MAADRIRISEPSPPHCSGCYQAKPHMRHIDFEAAWDGPTLPALEGAVGVVGHHIDELILCEQCISDAAKLLGLEDVTELRKSLVMVEETRDRLLERVAALEENNQHLRQAVASGEQLDRVRRPAPIMPRPAASSPQDAPERKPSPKREPKPNRATGQRRQSAAAKAAEARP